eukprot:8241382-Pyramimonas_sp.AAC.1
MRPLSEAIPETSPLDVASPVPSVPRSPPRSSPSWCPSLRSSPAFPSSAALLPPIPVFPAFLNAYHTVSCDVHSAPRAWPHVSARAVEPSEYNRK